jgi:hypothetical protein
MLPKPSRTAIEPGGTTQVIATAFAVCVVLPGSASAKQPRLASVKRELQLTHPCDRAHEPSNRTEERRLPSLARRWSESFELRKSQNYVLLAHFLPRPPAVAEASRQPEKERHFPPREYVVARGILHHREDWESQRQLEYHLRQAPIVAGRIDIVP